MLIEVANPAFPIVPPRVEHDVGKLRARIEGLVEMLGDDFPSDMVARALMVQAADMLLAHSNALQAIWAAQRVVGLLAGQYTRETTNLMISTPNC